MHVLKQRKTEFSPIPIPVPVLKDRKKNKKADKKAPVLPVDPVAICLLYFLLRSRTNYYQNTMTGLLRQLVQTAEHMGMEPCQIPVTPRMLGIRLEMLEPGLEEMLGIKIAICRVNDVPRSVQIIV